MQFIDLKHQYQSIKPRIDQAILKVLNHGQYILGSEVFELEVKLAAYSGTKYCVSCSSGTDALLMSLMAKGIGRGEEGQGRAGGVAGFGLFRSQPRGGS